MIDLRGLPNILADFFGYHWYNSENERAGKIFLAIYESATC